MCPVCCDPIEDAVGKKKGQDAVFCDGSCQDWIHRQCAGLSKHAYSLVSDSDEEFHCPRCQLSDLTKAIGLLNSELSLLKARITSLETSSVSHNSETVNNSMYSSPTTTVRTASPKNSGPNQKASPTDKKLNLVFYGIPECPTGTSFHERLESDCDAILSFAKSSDSVPLPTNTIKDCFRLGKYQQSSQAPRPLLVKFNSVKVVNTLLRKSLNNNSPSNSIRVKREMSKQEMKVNHILLKERFRLVTEEHIAKHLIRLKGHKLLVNNRPYGEVQSGSFVVSSSLADSSSSLQNHNLSEDDMETSNSLTTSAANDPLEPDESSHLYTPRGADEPVNSSAPGRNLGSS